MCHIKNSELDQNFEKYKGLDVLRSDIVTDDSGSTPYLRSISNDGAKVIDVVARLPRCAGQAVDAVSACTEVKIEDALALLTLLTLKCPEILILLRRHKWTKSWSNIEDLVDPPKPIFIITHLLAYNAQTI